MVCGYGTKDNLRTTEPNEGGREKLVQKLSGYPDTLGFRAFDPTERFGFNTHKKKVKNTRATEQEQY